MAEEPLRTSHDASSRRILDGVFVETFSPHGPIAIVPALHQDARGSLSETFSRRRFGEIGVDVDFVQDNQTVSTTKGTIRGLHFQIPPKEQGKLVRVLRGAILDVAVDIRHGSPAFGRAIALELSAENRRQFYVPPGFAHGFCTLTPDAEVLYRMTQYYAPEADRGLAFDDPELAIEWPVELSTASLSEKDRHHPCLRDLPVHFRFEPSQ